MSTLSDLPTQRTRRSRGRTAPWPAATAVAATAVAAAAVIWLIAGAVGVDLVVETGGRRDEVGLASVVAGSAIGAVAGVLVLELALRYFARGRRWWTIGAFVSLLGSLTSPMASTTAAAWIVLSLMHIVVGAVVIVGLRRAVPGDVA